MIMVVFISYRGHVSIKKIPSRKITKSPKYIVSKLKFFSTSDSDSAVANFSQVNKQA